MLSKFHAPLLHLFLLNSSYFLFSSFSQPMLLNLLILPVLLPASLPSLISSTFEQVSDF